jgi:hypothetical protein
VIIFAGLAFVGLLVWLLGGRLSALGELPVTAKPAIIGAFGLQLFVTMAPTALPESTASALHLGSYALAVWFLWANRRLPYLWVAAAGGACNLLAIAANGGSMPAAPAALRSAGLVGAEDVFANSGHVEHARLAFLGDIWSIPKGWPFANVFSFGDVVLLLGAAALVLSVCGAPRLTRALRSSAPRAEANEPAEPVVS